MKRGLEVCLTRQGSFLNVEKLMGRGIGVVKVECQCDAVARRDGCHFVLDIAVKRREADRRFGALGKLFGGIERPLIALMAHEEGPAGVLAGEYDHKRGEHVFSAWSVLVRFEERVFPWC